MLQLRPNCECCDRDLPPESAEAMICSFECTFCRSCAEAVLAGRCPNCGGELVRRPIRPGEKLVKYPASAGAQGESGRLRTAAGRLKGLGAHCALQQRRLRRTGLRLIRK